MIFQTAVKGMGTVGGFGAGRESFLDTSDLKQYNPDKRMLRRTDHFTRLALLAAYRALADAGMADAEHPLRQGMGIITATGFGPTCNVFDTPEAIDPDDPCGSPTKFSNSVPNAAAAHLALLLTATGPNHAINHFDLSVPLAFSTAALWIREGRCRAVLVGGVDEYFRALEKIGHVPEEAGEGAAFFILTGEDRSEYGHICEIETGTITQTAAKMPVKLPAGISEKTIVITGNPAQPTDDAMPCDMAFDVALAAASLKSGHMPVSLNRLYDTQLNKIASVQKIPAMFRCLKTGVSGRFGMIAVSNKSC